MHMFKMWGCAHKTRKDKQIMINESGLTFTNISSEQYRVYEWESGKTIHITCPTDLNVSKNGHRILDANGISHYIPSGWIHLYWSVKKGKPNFVK